MSVIDYLNEKGFMNFEGGSYNIELQTRELRQLVSSAKIKTVLEIGFNNGHSSDIFLQSNPNCKVTSFDLGEHEYVSHAKEYIDLVFPDRHTLILGDSTKTIPDYSSKNPNQTFDFIFIDGGHAYEVAKADVENCFQLSHKDTVLVVDDITTMKEFEREWTIGPTRVWEEYTETGMILPQKARNYTYGRGMSWGKYVHAKK